jgi:hypothetical protein
MNPVVQQESVGYGVTWLASSSGRIFALPLERARHRALQRPQTEPLEFFVSHPTLGSCCGRDGRAPIVPPFAF